MRQKGIAYIVYYSHFFFRVSHRHCVIRSYFIINCTRFILVCVFYFGDLENSYRIFTFCAKTTKIDNKFALKFLLDYEIRWKKNIQENNIYFYTLYLEIERPHASVSVSFPIFVFPAIFIGVTRLVLVFVGKIDKRPSGICAADLHFSLLYAADNTDNR